MMTFESMSSVKKWFSNWKKQYKFSIYNPSNFREVFSFVTTKTRFISLLILSVLFLCFLIVLLIVKTPLGEIMINSEAAPSQSEIINQRKQVDSLARQVRAQDLYIRDFKRMLFGKLDTDTTDTTQKGVTIDLNKINPNPSSAEIELEGNVKSNKYTKSSQSTGELIHFLSPVKGKISQRFNDKTHRAIDIVAVEGTYFYACLSGTVIFSDYSHKDGNILIIEHSNNYLSIYKHAKTTLKKIGDKVRVGDVIGIIGNSGTNTTGPHLHFELWFNQQSIDPEKYIDFE